MDFERGAVSVAGGKKATKRVASKNVRERDAAHNVEDQVAYTSPGPDHKEGFMRVTGWVRSVLAGALMLGTMSVFGQATRTWVSGVGDDVNPCSRTAPCKTFA